MYMETQKPKRKGVDGIRSVKKRPLAKQAIFHKEQVVKNTNSSTKKHVGSQKNVVQKKLPKPKQGADDFYIHREPISPELYINPKRSTFSRKTKFKFFAFLSFSLLVFIFFTLLDHTVVDVVATTETQSITKNIKAQLYPSDNQLGFDVISVAVENEMVLYPETETVVSEYAQGTVRIFNNYSTQPQRLIEETRLEAVGGQIFKIPKGNSVIIPGKTGDTPGFADVLVYAAEPGPEYNIDLTDFTIPGFKEAGLDAKHIGIYGLSTAAMSGGYSGTKKILSQDQIDQASLELQQDIKHTLESRIQAEKTHQFFLVNGAAEISLGEIDLIEEGGSVRLKQTARGSSMIISQENLDAYIVNTFFPETHDYQLTITGYNNLDISISGLNSLHNTNAANLKISADVSYAYLLNEDSVITSLLSREKNTLLPLFIEMKEVSYAHVNIFPFWRQRTSDLPNRFRVNILSS